jgi:hypothetical protein
MSEEAILTDLLKILGGILSGGIGVAIVNKRLLGKDKEVDVAAQLRDELRLSETDSRNRAVVTESRMWEVVQICVMALAALSQLLAKCEESQPAIQEQYEGLSRQLNDILSQMHTA